MCSVVLVYDDSQRLSLDGTAVEPLSTYASGKQILAELAGGKPLSVRLEGEGSPLSLELSWKLATPLPAAGVTSDYFLYLLYVPGALAAYPLYWLGRGIAPCLLDNLSLEWEGRMVIDFTEGSTG